MLFQKSAHEVCHYHSARINSQTPAFALNPVFSPVRTPVSRSIFNNAAWQNRLNAEINTGLNYRFVSLFLLLLVSRKIAKSVKLI